MLRRGNITEWLRCLQDAVIFQTGFQLHRVFVIILVQCAPMDPNRLWKQYRNHLCDDLEHYLQNPNTIPHIPYPTLEQIFDYGLHLIADALQKCGKSIQDFDMPRPQMNWGVYRGNQLINEQMAFNVPQLQEFVQRGQATLNVKQRNFYQAVLDSVRNTTDTMFFL